MPSSSIEKIVKILRSKYNYIIGENKKKSESIEKIVENITTYYESIIGCMPGNVYWLDKKCITLGCNQNVLDMFGLKTLDEFKG